MSTNVKFLRGLEADLFKAEHKAYEDGCFYLTTDTNRLYVGVKVGNVVNLESVNEGVKTVSTKDDLPNLTDNNKAQYAGRFYYITGLNVLAVASGTNWVQINPDTTLAPSTQAITVGDKSSKKVDVSTSVLDTKRTSVTGKFSLEEGDNITLTPDKENKSIKIDAHDTTYSLGTSNANDKVTANLTSSTGETGGSIEFSAEADAGSVTDNGVTTTNKYGDLFVSTQNDTIEYKVKINRQSPTAVAVAPTTGDNATGFTVTVTNPLDKAISGSFDPVIAYGENYGTVAKFEAGKAELDVYTKTETDKQISDALTAADAMKFEGVLTSQPTEGVANAGSTYKVGTAGIYFGIACRVGDLLIAKADNTSLDGTDFNNWYHIPSGDDQVIQGEIDTTSHKISINDNASSNPLLASLDLDEGTDIVLSSKANGKALTTTITHKTYDEVTPSSDGVNRVVEFATDDVENFTAISKITTSNGHITEIETSTIEIHDTHNKITGIENKASSISGGISLETNVSTADADGQRVTPVKLNITSSSLDMAITDKNNATINLVWGSF